LDLCASVSFVVGDDTSASVSSGVRESVGIFGRSFLCATILWTSSIAAGLNSSTSGRLNCLILDSILRRIVCGPLGAARESKLKHMYHLHLGIGDVRHGDRACDRSRCTRVPGRFDAKNWSTRSSRIGLRAAFIGFCIEIGRQAILLLRTSGMVSKQIAPESDAREISGKVNHARLVRKMEASVVGRFK
jgi:hypothetical protein